MHEPDYYLLTPGPITTSRTVKEAMLCDWGSWDQDFNAVTDDIRQQLLAAANAKPGRLCLCPASRVAETFAVEATIATLARFR